MTKVQYDQTSQGLGLLFLVFVRLARLGNLGMQECFSSFDNPSVYKSGNKRIIRRDELPAKFILADEQRWIICLDG